MALLLYNFFHLNLAYSAIEEEARPRVIEQCYWPLLRLARKRNLPFGIELSGYTLEVTQALDPRWVEELKSLVKEGPCELIGSGYAQVIGPLVPHEVTSANLRLGHAVYERILGVRPRIALINEQAFSAGSLPAYRSAGYEAVIMEWNNPASANPDWNPEMRFLPQRALDPKGENLPLIWNKSIAFQKFQRYVHGELELDEILEYIKGHISEADRAMSLYGNDVEIFDFRPGRYMTEAPISEESEWLRITRLYDALGDVADVSFIAPGQALELIGRPGAGNEIALGTASHPVPVKKQNKYNVLRWAVTGRNDLEINTRCERLTQALLEKDATDDDWQDLCYLWSSDFRTHITKSRWAKYQDRLSAFEKKHIPSEKKSRVQSSRPGVSRSVNDQERFVLGNIRLEKKGRLLKIDGERLKITLNCHRGLALESFVDMAVAERSLFGTLRHGFFDDIRWGADYYSGHLIFESPGRHKITDLVAVSPYAGQQDGLIVISASIPLSDGLLRKKWILDDLAGLLRLCVELEINQDVLGSLRLGHVTLNPHAFDEKTLFYRTQNGGQEMETFPLTDQGFDHGQSLSFLISAQHAVGITGGCFEFGDKAKTLRIGLDRSQAVLPGLVTHQKVGASHFTRLALSAREVDDTSHPVPLALGFEAEISASRSL